ncbi:MAG: hypothetical protein NT013_21305, partial [Planctomycetia bacterium]|nr:hypothetical protein [Planctomycetia bacterium]
MPATLVNPMTLTYQDLDGDDVTVKFSQPILTTANVNSIFTFSSGAGAVNASNNAQELLTKLNLTSVTTATPTNITTTAIRSATHGGDGVATLGEINATGKTLGTVILDGDLGRIVALGVKGLTVQSAGRFGAATGATDLNSQIDGNLGALTVKGDFKDVFLSVSGDLGPVAITGSLIGGGNANSGNITGAKLNSVVVGGDLVGGIGTLSAVIKSASTTGIVTVKGSIRGGIGNGSGLVTSASPETSELFLERVLFRVTKKKSLGDLWCLRMVNKSSHTSHGGISSEQQCGEDREEVGSSQA